MAASDRGDRHASDASMAASGSNHTANALRLALLERLESVLAVLFPDGKTRRGTFLIGDVLGSAGDSLEVVLTGEKAGLWIDRAEGTGGDVFDLIAAHHRLDARSEFPRVLEEARRLLGRAPSSPVPKSEPHKRPPTEPLGPATAHWEYRDTAGHLLAVVYRYDPPGGKKQFRPWDALRRKWAAPVPRPLYHQPGIVERPKFMQHTRAHQAMLEFRIGERVWFENDLGVRVEGMIVRYNRKSVSLVTGEGQPWRAGPRFLRKMEGDVIDSTAEHVMLLPK